MTSQSPRIYVYKITFEEVSYYYYGVHKEKNFNEYYMGSPKTHKNFWELYTPIKQIIKEFPFTDQGWVEANYYEDSLIEPVYNIDPLCLNESCGAVISLDVVRKTGQKCYELGIGIHGRTKEQMTEDAKKSGQKTYELGIGIHKLTKEQRSENSKKGGKLGGKRNVETGHIQNLGRIIGQRNIETGHIQNLGKIYGTLHKELGIGIFGRTEEQIIEDAKNGAKKAKELGVGVFGLTKDQLSNQGKKTNSQRWMCIETGYISNPGGLSKYQRAKGIDTSKRKRIE
jgi:hypothetical protein